MSEVSGAEGESPPVSPLKIALGVISAVLDEATPAEAALRRELRANRSLDNEARGAVARCSLGTLCLRRRLGHLLDHVSATAPSLPFNEHRTAGLLGIYALHEESKYFPEQASAARERDWTDVLPADLVNAINTLELSAVQWPEEALGSMYSLPDWLAELLLAQFGPEQARSLADATNHPGPITLRVNSNQCTREELIALLESSDGITAVPTTAAAQGLRITDPPKPNIWGSECWRKGLFEVQDEGSQLAATATGASGTDLCIDVCAGRGGKAIALASVLSSDGLVIAHDVDAKAMRDIGSRAQRAGVGSQLKQVCTSWGAEVVGGRGGDVASLTSDEQIKHPQGRAFDVPKVLLAAGRLADVVMVDAPCSSLGTLRRGANVRWELSGPAVLSSRFCELQLAVLESAADLVAVGGVLVYSTCTFVEQENQQVADRFSLVHGDRFQASALHLGWGQSVAESVLGEAWETSSSVQLLPDKHNTDGFFISRWRRVA